MSCNDTTYDIHWHCVTTRIHEDLYGFVSFPCHLYNMAINDVNYISILPSRVVTTPGLPPFPHSVHPSWKVRLSCRSHLRDCCGPQPLLPLCPRPRDTTRNVSLLWWHCMHRVWTDFVVTHRVLTYTCVRAYVYTYVLSYTKNESLRTEKSPEKPQN